MPTSPKVITHSYSSTEIVYTSTYLNLFTHLDTTNCPVTSCTLQDSTCNSAMATSTNFFMTNLGVAPYAANAKQNIEAGWTNIVFCYRCTVN